MHAVKCAVKCYRSYERNQDKAQFGYKIDNESLKRSHMEKQLFAKQTWQGDKVGKGLKKGTPGRNDNRSRGRRMTGLSPVFLKIVQYSELF